jgi:hypothetical protein
MKAKKIFWIFLKISLSFGFTLFAIVSFSQKSMQPLDEWTVQVNNQFRYYEKELGLTNQSHTIATGSLEDDASEWILVDLESGYTYQILGVCDNDCYDLDLEVYSLSNALIARDMATDDYPLVSITPTSGAKYRIKVTMENCSANPCRFGLAVYRKD